MSENGIVPFIYDESPVRGVLDDKDAPWFVAKDVCRILDIADHRQAVEILDEDEKGGYKIPTLSRGLQEATCINEAELQREADAETAYLRSKAKSSPRYSRLCHRTTKGNGRG
jgi:prophage antirepressor-like protein